jgi:hypothetical protein
MTADAGGSDATNALRQSIEQFNAKTARQTTWLLRLTWTLAALTLGDSHWRRSADIRRHVNAC